VVPGVFRQFRVHIVPGLSAFREDIHGGTMPTRIVKAARSHADYLGHGRGQAKQLRSAVRAKAAAHGIATVRRCCVEARRALSYSKGWRWDAEDGCIRRPCSPLTIVAMAVKCKDRSGGTFIADGAACASACEMSRHRSMLFCLTRNAVGLSVAAVVKTGGRHLRDRWWLRAR
jgi:hypothetical protein